MKHPWAFLRLELQTIRRGRRHTSEEEGDLRGLQILVPKLSSSLLSFFHIQSIQMNERLFLTVQGAKKKITVIVLVHLLM